MTKNKVLILKKNVCTYERVALSSVAERQTQRSALVIFWNTERPVTSTMCVPFNNNSLVVNFSISQQRFLTTRALDAENLLQYVCTWVLVAVYHHTFWIVLDKKQVKFEITRTLTSQHIKILHEPLSSLSSVTHVT